MKIFKQLLSLTLVSSLLCPISTLAAPSSTELVDVTTSVSSSPVNSTTFSSYDDPILADLIEKMGLTEEEVNSIDQQITALKQEKVLGFGIAEVTALIASIKLNYEGGRYAARQCEVRFGLTKSYYKEHRWEIRALMTLAARAHPAGVAIAPFLLGFDDHFMGV